MPKLHWKKKKLLTILANRRQWQREFDPDESTAVEIEMEHLVGTYLARESSTAGAPTYIITE